MQQNITNNGTTPFHNDVNVTIFILSTGGLFLIVLVWISCSARILGFTLTKFLNIFFKFILRNKDIYFNVNRIYVQNLGGKVLFKHLTIITSDMSVFVLDGYLTIRWWLFWKRKYYFTTKDGKFESNFHVNINGVEMMMYNKNVSYEYMLDLISKRKGNSVKIVSASEKSEEKVDKEEYLKPDGTQKLLNWAKSIGINIWKGNFIIGNHTLPCYLQIGFKSGLGLVRTNTTNKKSFDIYKLLFEIDLSDSTINLLKKEGSTTKPYYLSEVEVAGVYLEHLSEVFEKYYNQKNKNYILRFLNKLNLSRDSFPKLYVTMDRMMKQRVPYMWKGRYDPKLLFVKKISEELVVSCPLVKVCYYWDKPGIVPEEPMFSRSKLSYPDHGIDIAFKNMGNRRVVYGPFADHQRSLLQEFFSPVMYQNTEFVQQEIGKLRIHKFFDLNINFDVEQGKTCRWQMPYNRTPETVEEKDSGKSKQEYMEILFSQIQISFKLAMRSFTEKGYTSQFQFNFKDCVAKTSSTDQHRFFNCENFEFSIEYSSHGNDWNSMKLFNVKIAFLNGEMCYLNLHRKFLQQFIKDWMNYPNKVKPTLKKFVPKKYSYKFEFKNVNFVMHANNHNIIEEVNDKSKNIFVMIHMPEMNFDLFSPSLEYNPLYYEYKANVSVNRVGEKFPYFTVILPEGHPLKKSLGKENHLFLSGKKATINVSYIMHTKVRSDFIDVLKVDFEFYNAKLLANAYYLRFLLQWYFNHFTSKSFYISLLEFVDNGYKNKRSKQVSILQNTDKKGFRYPQNENEIVLGFKFYESTFDLPLYLYSTKDQLGNGSVSHIGIEINSNNKYCEICINTSPIVVELSKKRENSKRKLKFFGIDFVNLWLFMEFGPYPDCNVYHIILNLLIGDIISEVDYTQIKRVLRFLNVFFNQFSSAYPYNEKTDSNKPDYSYRTYRPEDVSKYRMMKIVLRTRSINSFIYCKSGILNLELSKGLSFLKDTTVDDSLKYNNRMRLRFPSINLQFLSEREAHQKVLGGDYSKVGHFVTGIQVIVNTKKPTIEQDYIQQQEFICIHQEDINVDAENPDSDDDFLNDLDELETLMVKEKDVISFNRIDFAKTIEIEDDQQSEVDDNVEGNLMDEETIEEYTYSDDQKKSLTNVKSVEFHTAVSEYTASDSLSEFEDALSDVEEDDEINFKSKEHKTEEIIEIEEKDIHLDPKLVRHTVVGFNRKKDKKKKKNRHTISKKLKKKEEDDDDQETFGFYEKGGEIKIGAYRQYLKNFDIEREHRRSSPLRPDNFGVGTFETFPSTKIIPSKNNFKYIDEIYKINTNENDFSFTNKNNSTKTIPPESNPNNECVEKHVNIKLLNNVDIFVTPHVISILEDIVCKVIEPWADVDYVIDEIEMMISKNEKKERKKKSQEEEEQPCPNQKLVFSCYLQQLSVHIIQSIKTPELYSSPYLGKLTTYSIKFLVNNIYGITSITSNQDKQSIDKYASISGKLSLESMNLLIHCLNRRKQNKMGLSFDQLRQSVVDNKMENYPLVLSCCFEELEINAFLKTLDHFVKGGVSCSDNIGIEFNVIQEIPAILYHIVTVWLIPVNKFLKRVSKLSKMEQGYRLYLVSFLTKDEQEIAQKSNAEPDFSVITIEKDGWVLPSFEKYPPRKALENLRDLINYCSKSKEREYVSGLKRIRNLNNEKLLAARREVSFYYISLFEKNEEIGGGAYGGKELFDKQIRGDLSVFLKQIKFSIHSLQETESTIYFRDIKIEGIGKIQEKQTSIVLKRLRKDSRGQQILDINLMISSCIKHISVNIHPHTASFVSCLLGVLIENRKNKQIRDETTREINTLFQTRAITSISSRTMDLKLPNQPRRQRKKRFNFFVFGNFLFESLEGRAWIGEKEGLNYMKLDFEKISFIFNQPLNQNKREKTKLVHSTIVSIDKIQFVYNYALQTVTNSENNFLLLFQISVNGLQFMEFYGKDNNKANPDKVNILFLFQQLNLKIPYTGIEWVDAIKELRDFLDIWRSSLQKPVKNALSSMNVKEKIEIERKKPFMTTKKVPMFNINIQLSNINIFINFLKQISLELKFPRIFFFLNEETKENVTFRLNVESNSIRFQPTVTITKKVFEKTQFLPKILLFGRVDTSKKKIEDNIIDDDDFEDLSEPVLTKKRDIMVMTYVDEIKNSVNTENLNYIISFQATITKEIIDLISKIQNTLRGVKTTNIEDLTKKIEPTLAPLAQKSYKEVKKINYSFKVKFNSINFSLVGGQPLEIILFVEKMHVISDSNQIFSGKVKSFSLKMIDSYRNEKGDSFVWGSINSNISIKTCLSESKKRLFFEVNNTSILFKPGFVEQLILLYRDYQTTAKSLKKIFDHIDKNKEVELVKEKMVEVYPKEYVINVSKKVTRNFRYNLLIKIENTIITLPIGEDPYYSVIKDIHSNFKPESFLHCVISSANISAIIKSIENELKIVGVVRIKDLLGFLKKENYVREKKGYLIDFKKSSNKFKLGKMEMKFNTFFMKGVEDNQRIKTNAIIEISSPVIVIDPYIFHVILLIKNDFSPFKTLESKISTITATKVSRKRGLSSFGKEKIKKGVVLFQLSSKVSIQSGSFDLKCSLGNNTILSAKLPLINGNIILSPLKSEDFLFSNRINTHVQISLKWEGLKVSQNLMLYAKEVFYIYEKYKDEKKKKKKKTFVQQEKKLSTIETEGEKNGDEGKVLKPLTWIKYVKAAIIIQRIFKGHLTRKIIKEEIEKHGRAQFTKLFYRRKKQKKRSTLVSSNTFSLLFRIQPFYVQLNCEPIGHVSLILKFSHPFDLIFSRAERNINFGNYKGISLYNTMFLSSPEIIVKMCHSLANANFFRFRFSGIKSNIGSGTGFLLRHDREPVYSGYFQIDKIMLESDISQLDQLFIMYITWKQKWDDMTNKIKLRETEKEKEEESLNPLQKKKKLRNSSKKKRKKILLEEISKSATPSYFLQFIVKQIHIQGDFTVTIGQQFVDIVNLCFFFKDRGRFLNNKRRERLHFEGYLQSLRLNARGRSKGVVVNRLTGLNGEMFVRGVAFGLNRHFRVEGETSIFRGRSDLFLRISSIKINFKYHLDGIFYFLTKDICAKFRDKFDSDDGKRFHVQCVFLTDTVLVNISSSTVPIILNLIRNMNNIIKDKRNIAIETLSDFTFRIDEIEEDETTGNKKKNTIKKILQTNEKIVETFLNLTPIGNLSIKMKKLELNLYDKFDIVRNISKDTIVSSEPFTKISSNYAEISLGILVITKKIVDKTAKVLRVVLFNADVQRGFASKNDILLLSIPDSILQMLSTQKKNNNVIEYEFMSKFENPIKVSTNINEYNFFRKIISMYKKNIEKEVEQFDYDFSSNNDDSQNLKSSNEKKEKDGKKEKFVSLQFCLNPKLNVLGDLTPTVSHVLGWLGIKDENAIPKLIHNSLTKSMVKILNNSFYLSYVLDNFFEEK